MEIIVRGGSSTEHFPLGNLIGQGVFHETGWLGFELNLCVHASVDRAVEITREMTVHSTIRHLDGRKSKCQAR